MSQHEVSLNSNQSTPQHLPDKIEYAVTTAHLLNLSISTMPPELPARWSPSSKFTLDVESCSKGGSEKCRACQGYRWTQGITDTSLFDSCSTNCFTADSLLSRSNHKVTYKIQIRGRAVTPWKRVRLTIRKPGFDPRPGVLFGCEGFQQFPCCTLSWLNPPARGRINWHYEFGPDSPPREPLPVRPWMISGR